MGCSERRKYLSPYLTRGGWWQQSDPRTVKYSINLHLRSVRSNVFLDSHFQKSFWTHADSSPFLKPSNTNVWSCAIQTEILNISRIPCSVDNMMFCTTLCWGASFWWCSIISDSYPHIGEPLPSSLLFTPEHVTDHATGHVSGYVTGHVSGHVTGHATGHIGDHATDHITGHVTSLFPASRTTC